MALGRQCGSVPWGVGVLLSAFGLYFAGVGLGVHWPGNAAAILYLILALSATSQIQAHWLARQPEPDPQPA